ncbi:MAG: SIMPL domain-containing protein [Caldilineaceae bacterium]
MKPAFRLFLSSVLLATLLLFPATRLLACSCAYGPPLLDTLAYADAIFSGTVTDIYTATPFTGDTITQEYVTVHVKQTWKGPSNQVLTLTNFPGCPYDFTIGKAYLIFASGQEGQLYVSLCNRIQPLEKAAQDISVLADVFASIPHLQYQTPATVTVRGYTQIPIKADQISVRFLLTKPQTAERPSDAQQERFVAKLSEKGISQAMLAFGGVYGDQNSFNFTVNQEKIANNDTAAFLGVLNQTQVALTHDDLIPIKQVEVMFSLEDCTRSAAQVKRQALFNARTQAELLADSIGGRLGGIVGITDNSPLPNFSANEYPICGTILTGKWYTLPLNRALDQATTLNTAVNLSVTFGIEQAVSGVQKLPELLRNQTATPTPDAISPLATPAH